ncbi:MAG: 50S ribosomal protein L25 [Gemmatimonadetes bacterium]|nr:50S ribosomal protein L25 [Gemmatimonadota bacterium]
MTITLKAQKREGTGKGVARKLRQEGRVPAVLYGRELGTMHLSLDTHEAENLFHSISTENTIVGLKVEGVGELFQTLVREIQSHPFKSSLIHVDFLRIQAGVAVDVEVPLRLIGDPIGVKNSGGVLEQVLNELPVKCIPSKIPEFIEVDVSELDINDSLHVYDLELEEGINITVDEERTICAVAIPKVVEEAVVEEDELLEGDEGEIPDEEALPSDTAVEESPEDSDGDRD